MAQRVLIAIGVNCRTVLAGENGSNMHKRMARHKNSFSGNKKGNRNLCIIHQITVPDAKY